MIKTTLSTGILKEKVKGQADISEGPDLLRT